METIEAVKAVFSRMPGVRLRESSGPPLQPNFMFRGPSSLHVEYDSAAE